MDLSIIIAHYNPGNHPECVDSFKKTLDSISSQRKDFKIEIIIADDGSLPNNSIQNTFSKKFDQNGRDIYLLQNSILKDFLKLHGLNDFPIDKWLYLPKKIKCMSKARVLNLATSLASSDNLFFLDDDNYFISQDPITRIVKYFKKYQLIIGQVKDSNNRLRTFSSKRVQGTTLGIKKDVLLNAGQFGEWTESVSCGVDSDLWWKLYKYFKKNESLKACFSSDIRTIDSCSKRWKPFINSFFRKRKLVKAFMKEHSCPNLNSVKHNPSRNKENWITNLS